MRNVKKILTVCLLMMLMCGCRTRGEDIILEYSPDAVTNYLAERNLTYRFEEKPQLGTKIQIDEKHTVTFVDTTPPVVSFNDPKLDVNYIEGITILDNYDETEDCKITISRVNIYETGKYNGTITVEDKSGNKTKINEKVTVVTKLDSNEKRKFDWKESYPSPIMG